MADETLVLDDLPDDVQATIEARNRALAALGHAEGGLEFLIARMQRWLPGSTVQFPGAVSGPPNFWSRAKVDHNVNSVSGPGIEAGPFDRRSVMLYRFPPLFSRTPNSDCAPASDGQALSDGDRAGLRSLYPETESEVAAVFAAKGGILESLQAAGNLPDRGRGTELEEPRPPVPSGQGDQRRARFSAWTAR